jgi:DNA-binding IclR family transcriptional regulator
MTTITLFPGIRDIADAILARFTRSRSALSVKAAAPETRTERREAMEEMLLAYPACCASEFGMQWMYINYRRG